MDRTGIDSLELTKIEPDEQALAVNPAGWGFDIWDVRDGQGRYMGKMAHMPERKKRDGTRHDDGKDWYASVEWIPVGASRGLTNSRSSFHETRELALEAMVAFFEAGTWADGGGEG